MSSHLAWSFSHTKAFGTCPRKYEAEMVQKLYPFKESDATRYGNQVHKALELYVKEGTPLGPHAQFQRVIDKLLQIPGEKIAERKQALTRDLEPCSYFDKRVWLRGVADLTIIDGAKGWVVDYKTGSAKYPDVDQLELMALMVFVYHPDVREVNAALLFVLHNKLVPARYVRKDADKLWKKWERKYQELVDAKENNRYPPNPNGLCRNWCPVEHCEYQG